MKNFILILLMMIILAISGCAHNRHHHLQTEPQTMRKAEQKAAKKADEPNIEENRAAHNCNVLPGGSYRNSCRSCQAKTTDACTDLTCECRDQNNQWHWSITSKISCPQNKYCNNNGVLQCGDC